LLSEACKYTVTDFKDTEQVLPVIRSVLCPKIPVYFDYFSNLVTKACMQVMGDNPKGFDVEYIRVAKILGGSLYDSEVLNGLMIERAP